MLQVLHEIAIKTSKIEITALSNIKTQVRRILNQKNEKNDKKGQKGQKGPSQNNAGQFRSSTEQGICCNLV